MTCTTDAVIVLLTCVAGGLTWVGWGLWALHEQRRQHRALDILYRNQEAERRDLFAELSAPPTLERLSREERLERERRAHDVRMELLANDDYVESVIDGYAAIQRGEGISLDDLKTKIATSRRAKCPNPPPPPSPLPRSPFS